MNATLHQHCCSCTCFARPENSNGKKPKTQGVYENPKGSGVWWVRIPLGNRAYRREKVGDYHQAVRRYRSSVEKARDRTGPTIEEAVERYFSMRERTDPGYRCAARALFRLVPPGTPLVDFATIGALRTWQLTRLKQVQASSVNREMAFLSGVFNQAIDDQHLEDNLIGKGRGRLNYPGRSRQRTRWMTDAEETQLLEALNEDGRETMLFIVNTGLRRKEAWKLEWSDWNGDSLFVDISKNGRSRDLVLNAVALKVLRDRKARGLSRPFPGKSVQTYAARFNRAARELSIKGLTFHSLRHTFATRLARQGTPIRVIQTLMGHSSVLMTERYIHVTDEQQHRAVADLARAQTGGPKGSVISNDTTPTDGLARVRSALMSSDRMRPRAAPLRHEAPSRRPPIPTPPTPKPRPVPKQRAISDVYTIEEVERIYGIPAAQLMTEVLEGRLRARRSGATHILTLADLAAWRQGVPPR